MPNSLQKLVAYAAKRNAATTNEPAAAEPAYSGARTSHAFVVHLHDARRRHYDLRLEVDGVLKSFAVPRGPSLAPDDRRLAVETEDHPIAYLDFEAVIPAGNYGAGPMIIWDTGTVRYLDTGAPEGLAQGKLDFELTGYKLRGWFTLIRSRGSTQSGSARELALHGDQAERGAREWLLIKKPDAYARAGAVVDESPRSVVSGLTVEELQGAAAESARLEQRAEALGALRREVDVTKQTPMLCTTADQVVDRPDFIYELKLDGFRLLAEKRGPTGALYYRGGGSASAAFPEVVRALARLPAHRVVLDGELVCLDERGRPSFDRLLARTGIRHHRDVSNSGGAPAQFVAFDVLALGPFDLRGLPLVHRKALLAEVVRGAGAVRALDHVVGSSRALMAFCEKEDLEGMVAKRADSRYLGGPRRSGDWVKVKRPHDEEFVVVGLTRGSGIRAPLGALDVASYRQDELVLRGRVGSGLDDRSVAALVERLSPLVSAAPTASGEPEPAPKGRAWVQPRVVIAVRFSGFTEQGRLRHPVFRGIRDDVAPSACTAAPALELAAAALAAAAEAPLVPRAVPAIAVTSPVDAGGAPAMTTIAADEARAVEAVRAASAAPPAHASSPSPSTSRPERARLTNAKKVFWPRDGLTKGDLCAYYERVASTLLPHLRDRPVVLVRYPDGIHGKSFYQWNVPSGTPSWVRTIELARDDDDGQRRVHGFVINDVETLRYVANLACIPIHVLAARTTSLDRCDFLTFDFDIGAQPFAHAVDLCRSLKALLDDIGLSGYPKTSGQSGLHVLVPMGDTVTFPVARVLVELLGRLLEQRHAPIATMERRVQERGARVYIDTGQTGRSRTIVAPYSVRAQEAAPVSTPLHWDEVTYDLSPGTLTITALPERIARLGDPMAAMLHERPNVPAAVARLEQKLKGTKR